MRLLILSLIIPLSGCASVYAGIQKCERHYNGTISGGTIQPGVLAGTARVDCCPVQTYSSPDHTHCLPLPGSSQG